MPTIKSPAEYAIDALAARMRSFQASLTDDLEMNVLVAGVPIAFRVTGVGFSSSFVVFYGRDADNNRVEALQNIAQVNVTLVAIPKEAGSEPRRIGFQTVPSQA